MYACMYVCMHACMGHGNDYLLIHDGLAGEPCTSCGMIRRVRTHSYQNSDRRILEWRSVTQSSKRTSRTLNPGVVRRNGIPRHLPARQSERLGGWRARAPSTACPRAATTNHGHFRVPVVSRNKLQTCTGSHLGELLLKRRQLVLAAPHLSGVSSHGMMPRNPGEVSRIQIQPRTWCCNRQTSRCTELTNLKPLEMKKADNFLAFGKYADELPPDTGRIKSQVLV